VVRHTSPSLFPSFSIRSRMGVILMLCGPPGGNEGLANALLHSKDNEAKMPRHEPGIALTAKLADECTLA